MINFGIIISVYIALMILNYISEESIDINKEDK